MGVTVQVRNLDPDVQQILRVSAEERGLSLSAFLREQLTDMARSLSVRAKAESFNSGRNDAGFDETAFAHIPTEQFVAWVREDRDR